MGIEAEIETYKARLPELLEKEGQWVVIRDNRVLGTWPNLDEALAAGHKAFGPMSFLCRQIQAVEPVHFLGGNGFH
jgi:hypothetical protein